MLSNIGRMTPFKEYQYASKSEISAILSAALFGSEKKSTEIFHGRYFTEYKVTFEDNSRIIITEYKSNGNCDAVIYKANKQPIVTFVEF